MSFVVARRSAQQTLATPFTPPPEQTMSGLSKLAVDRNKRQIEELAALPGNVCQQHWVHTDSCADCKTAHPRWASHNLGIFICMRCASVHRKLGTHITKVKSISLDSWTKEQVDTMRNMGNIKSNQIWNPDERRNPLPTNMEESERDSEMEKYIRSKYQFGRFKSKSAIVELYLGPSQSLASLPPRSKTAPIKSETLPASAASRARATPPPTLPREAPSSFSTSLSQRPATMTTPGFSMQSSLPSFSTSTPTLGPSPRTNLPPSTSSNTGFPQSSASMRPPPPPPIPANQQASLTSSTFNDLVSLQAPSTNASLPLQYQSTSSPFSSLSIGNAPSFATDRSPGFRSVSLPVSASPSYGQVPAITGNYSGMGSGAPSQFNPFFNQQQQQQQQQFGSPMGSPGGVSPGPFNPYSPYNQQQATQPFGSPTASPIAPQPQQPFANGYHANAFQQQSQFGGMSPVGGMQPFQQTPSPSIYQPFQQTPSPSIYQPQPPQQYQPPMSMSPPQQMYQPTGSPLSKEAQQAQQLFQSMGAGSGRNPFSFS